MTAITPTSATLNAGQVYPEGTVTTFRFVYGAGTETQLTVAIHRQRAGSGESVRADLGVANTLYVFQVIATNSNGTTDSDTIRSRPRWRAFSFRSATFRANVTDGTTQLVITRSGDRTHAWCTEIFVVSMLAGPTSPRFNKP